MRTVWSRGDTLMYALGVVLLLSGSSLAQGKKKPHTEKIKVFERPAEKKKETEKPKAAHLQVPVQRRSAAALADDARELQIATLEELIEMMDDSDPEKPELFMRMADLYWEKAEAFENKANATTFDERLIAAERADDQAEIQRIESERGQYRAKQLEWQDKAVGLYRRIEEGYPTYKAMDQVLYYLAYNLGLMGKGDEALAYYVRLASDHPNSPYLPDALFNVGEYYFDHNEFANALVFYEKVSNFQDSLVYGYAIYKQGWCHYNLGAYDNAFESFLTVIRYTDEMEAKGRKLPIGLKKEAMKDLVLTYSQVGAPGKALQFFKTVAPNNYLDLGAELADLYNDQGKYDESSRLLQTIIREDPSSYRILTYQRIIVRNADKRGDKARTAKEAERLVALYKKLQDTAPPEFIAKEKGKLDTLLRVLSTTYHKEFETTGNPGALKLSRSLYGVYVGLFPNSSDAYEMHRNYGVLLYQLKEYNKAVVEFEKVIEMRPDGPYTSDAAYLSLLCYYHMVTISSADEKTDDAGQLSERPLTDLEGKMVNACDRYVRIAGDAGDDVPEAKFAAAKILYDANHFKEAIPRFKNIIRLHDRHANAKDAARLLLSSYHLTRDIRNLSRWADRLAKEKPQLVTGELQAIIRRIRDRAEYNKCFVFEHDKQFRRAADCFVAYTQKFPSTELMDKALYYAAINFDKAHMMVRAIATFVDLYNRQTRSPLAPKALFAVGKVYHNAGVYSEASRYYEIYAKKHPKDEYVEEALRFASIFRKSLGDYDQAIADLESYLKLFPKSEKAPNIYFDIGTIYEKKRAWKSAIKHFQSYLRKYGKKGPLDLALLARLRIAKAEEKYKAARMQERARRDYAKLVEFFNKQDKKALEQVTMVGIGAVAEARFIEGEAVLAKALAIRITEKNIEQAMRSKLEIIAQAKKIFEDVFSFDHPHWQIAALNRVGVAYAELADTIETSPCPPKLNREQCEIYKQDLAVKADKIRQSAAELFRKCLETAREQNWFSRFSKDAEERLAQIDFSYRFTKEYRAQPTYVRAGACPAEFKFQETEETGLDAVPTQGAAPATGGTR